MSQVTQSPLLASLLLNSHLTAWSLFPAAICQLPAADIFPHNINLTPLLRSSIPGTPNPAAGAAATTLGWGGWC